MLKFKILTFNLNFNNLQLLKKLIFIIKSLLKFQVSQFYKIKFKFYYLFFEIIKNNRNR